MIKLLFVDDESNILQGMKRSLRKQRNEWDMSFADSGEQALIMLSENNYDAIITDMRMPGMNGAELLNIVKQHYPHLVRFILSGHSDQQLIMRSVGTSHQYLSKPCDLDILKQQLNKAFALRGLLSSESVQRISTNLSTIPSMPGIYRSVIEAMQSDDVSIKEIGKIIEQDIGMSAKILQLVNSAYFGIARKLSSPVEAANILGLDILKSLILSEGMFSQFDESLIKDLALEQIRSHSYKTASFSKAIAIEQNAGNLVADQAYLAGLLHKMGILVLAVNLPDKYREALSLIKKNNMDPLDVEREIFGTTHAEIGAYILALWGIDEDVITAIAYHNSPTLLEDNTFTPLTALVAAKYFIVDHNHEPAYKTQAEKYFDDSGFTEKISDWKKSVSQVIEDAA